MVSYSQKQFLFVVAIIAMLIDHVGLFLLDDNIYFRSVGRLALPIFCFGVGQAYIFSKDFQKYKLRLFILALISQVPYMFLFGMKANILFWLLVSAIGIELYNMRYGVVLYCVFLIISYFCFPVNSIYISLSCLVLYLASIYSSEKLLLCILFIAVQVFWSPLQIFACLSFFIICFPLSLPFTISPMFFYAFYPLHLFGIFLYGYLIR